MSFELDGLIPFDGDGHWYICLDYRIDKLTPEITYIDIECDNQEKIADSFSAYLSSLKLIVGDEYVINTDKTISEMANELESILTISFDGPDNVAHGYDVYRSQIGDAWIWLSPNLVPSGFVRKNDGRFEELLKLTKESATRFPEIPETSLLICFSDEWLQNRVVEKLKNGEIELRSLKEIVDERI